MTGPDARSLIAEVVDAGSWLSWDTEPDQPVSPGADYAQTLARARQRTGYDESVVTGEGCLAGRRVAVVACEFSFLAGSIGIAAAERLVRAVEWATAEKLPLLAAPASGGTRMQEGAVAFVQMVKISAAVTRHKAAGLPYLVYLRHPTTGGVFASWGSLGHVTAAEPGALIGFLGPRVYEAMHGEPFPEGVQVAENLYRHGLLDAVVPAGQLRDIACRVLDVVAVRAGGTAAESSPPEQGAGEASGWEAVSRSRRPERPGVRALLRVAAGAVTPLHGTGEGESEVALLLALASFGGHPCVVLGQDRREQRTQPLGPAELRVARRGVALAAELGLPLVTVVDTAGAALSREAEEGGLAAEIARCLADLMELPAPTVCVLLGEGAGGAALALLPADRVLAAQHGWLSPLPPEGASAILHGTTGRAAHVASTQRISATDLQRDGVVDRVIPERPDAADEREAFLARVSDTLAYELVSLHAQGHDERLAHRRRRYRALTLQ